ncbi:hypothetical protein ABPG73_020340 [Tetrahymena malaccensis]
MDMFPQMLNFNFQSFVNLNIQNNPDNSQLAIVRYKDKLLFQNFNSVILKQLKISFLPQSQICGLIFQDVADFVIIDNIQMNSLNNSTINCQQLEIDNSFLQIKNLTLNGEDFSNSQYLISAKNTQKVQINIFSQTFLQLQVVILILNINQISISNLTLNNSMLGDQFSILKQNTDIEAIVTNLTLTNNYCIKAVPPNSISTPLFSAGHYTVMLVNITDNVFCNKNMFEAITLFSQPYQIFSFSNISVINNIFYTRTSYLLINIDYSILLNPSHNFILQNSNFIKNSISMSSQNDIATSSFVQAAKLKNFSISNVSLIDHYQISLLKVQQAELVNITNFNCSNCKQYQSKQQLGQTAGCLYINEVKTLNMTQILCNYKQTYDVSLFQIDNIDYKQSQISIENSNFTNLQLYQTQMNSYVNPIQVSSSFNLSLQIQSCIFQNNYLSSIPISITYSTTGIWVQNFVGLVILKNVTYENSSSNSLYNNMHIQSQSLKIFNLTSKKSSFRQLNPQDTLFKQNGGVLNAIVNQLEILDSSFAQSTSQKGSFLYIQSFGNNLNISLLNTDFSEGYGLLDGGALFIDTQGNLINFSCKNCSFVNVYTFYQLSSSIAIQYNLAMQNKNQSYFHFDGGQIKNTLGISDNYFIQVQLSKLLFENVKNIKYEEFKSDSQAFQEFQSHPSKQQSTLFNLQDSQIQILNCGISDLNLINKQQQLPVIIKSSNSNIFINNTVIQNCLFAKSFINLQGSSIILDNTIIQNVNQVKDFRLMQKQINIEQPNNQENSLIVAKASTVQILNLSKFQQINCQKCNGGGISLINGNINIQDSVFSQIESLFGGAIFINDATGKNFIDNTKFLSCSSSFDGGALYAYLQNVNAINITISECQFENNISINGRGGAIFISSSSLNPTNIFSFIYGEFWESSYSKSTRYSCYNCSTYQLNILLILFLAGWTMFSMLVSIKGNNNYAKIHVAQLTILLAVSKKQKSLNSQTIETTKNILNKQQTHQTQKTSTSLSNRNQKSNNNKVINKDYITVQMKQSTYIKLFNNYIQIISSIATFNLSIPSANHRGVFKNSERLKSEVISSMSNSNQLLSESDKRSFNSDLSIKFEQQRNQVKQSRFLSLTDCNIKQTLKPTIVNLETFGEQSPPRTQNNLEQSFSDNTNMKTEKEITYE